MREQASQIDVAPFADPSQVPTPAGRRLTGREAEPTGKLPAAPKRVNVPDARDERRRCQHADPGDLLQAPRDGMLASNCGELVIDRGDARVERRTSSSSSQTAWRTSPGRSTAASSSNAGMRCNAVRAPAPSGRPKPPRNG